MGVEFKDKIILHGFREVKCWWEVGKLRWWEMRKCNDVARWKRQESGEVGMWEVPGFSQGCGTQGESKILSLGY